MNNDKILTYAAYIAMFIGGQLLSLFLIKIPALQKQAQIANANFVWKDWWKSDWYLVVGTNVLGAMLIIGLNEFKHFKPELIPFLRWIFGLVGALGGTFVMAKLSSYATVLERIADIKTNKADGIPDNRQL